MEWGQLQLEQSTWAMHARIEKIASGYLQMRVPPAARVHWSPPRAARQMPAALKPARQGAAMRAPLNPALQLRLPVGRARVLVGAAAGAGSAC